MCRTCDGAESLFWRVNMKPGAPVSTYQGAKRSASRSRAIRSQHTRRSSSYVRSVLEAVRGTTDLSMKKREAVLTNAFPKRATAEASSAHMYDAKASFEIPAQHDSGSLFSAAGCNALIDIPAGTGPLMAGTRVKGVLL